MATTALGGTTCRTGGAPPADHLGSASRGDSGERYDVRLLGGVTAGVPALAGLGGTR